MNKEELKKEAIKYDVDYPTSYGKGYKHKDLRVAYLAGAEPREKRIAELEKENAELKEELKNYEDLATVAYMQGADIQKKKYVEQLTEAKKIIQGLLELGSIGDGDYTYVAQAEQFIKDLEK